jgi:hypothetical protein
VAVATTGIEQATNLYLSPELAYNNIRRPAELFYLEKLL